MARRTTKGRSAQHIDTCSACTRGRYRHAGFAPADQRPEFTCTACGDTITKGHTGGDLAHLMARSPE